MKERCAQHTKSVSHQQLSVCRSDIKQAICCFKPANIIYYILILSFALPLQLSFPLLPIPPILERAGHHGPKQHPRPLVR